MKHTLIFLLALTLASCGTFKRSRDTSSSSSTTAAAAVDSSKAKEEATETRRTTTTVREVATAPAVVPPAVLSGFVPTNKAASFENDRLIVTSIPNPDGSISLTAFHKPHAVVVPVDRTTTTESAESASKSRVEEWVSADTATSTSEAEKSETRAEIAPPWWVQFTPLALLLVFSLVVWLQHRKRA